jgi:hypothetical protein
VIELEAAPPVAALASSTFPVVADWDETFSVPLVLVAAPELVVLPDAVVLPISVVVEEPAVAWVVFVTTAPVELALACSAALLALPATLGSDAQELTQRVQPKHQSSA